MGGHIDFIKYHVSNSDLMQKFRQHPIRNIKATAGQQPSEHPEIPRGPHFEKVSPEGGY